MLRRRPFQLARAPAVLCSALLLAAWACTFPSYTAPAPSAAAGSSAGTSTDVVSGAGGCDAATCDACPSGFADCDQDRSNGCEAALDTDQNCGSCGVVCTNPHGLNRCAPATGGSVAHCEPTCVTGYGDCDLRPESGCETSINQDSLNCGACGMACPSNGGTPLCVAGKCGLSSCNSGFGDCSNVGICAFNLNTDPENCGRCGHVCSSAHGTPSCNGGECEAACNTGYGDCNRDTAEGEPPNDGCETQLNVPDAGGKVPNCGACGAVCGRRAYTTVNLEKCAAGVCFLDCWNGAYDCDNHRNDPSCTGSKCGCEFVPCD
jgi:hypothetical protein